MNRYQFVNYLIGENGCENIIYSAFIGRSEVHFQLILWFFFFLLSFAFDRSIFFCFASPVDVQFTINLSSLKCHAIHNQTRREETERNDTTLISFSKWWMEWHILHKKWMRDAYNQRIDINIANRARNRNAFIYYNCI